MLCLWQPISSGPRLSTVYNRKSREESITSSVQAPPGTKVVKTATLQKSGLRCAEVKIEGVITGLIDTGSDITIMRGDLFYQIITATGLGEQALKKTDQKACTYDQKPITLDGQMEMEISFGEKTVITTVYVKLLAPDKLLLSETVCRLLGIITYHPSIQLMEKTEPIDGKVKNTELKILEKVQT